MIYIQHLIDAITLGSLYAIIGLGIALVFGIMRLVNFAHGELVMIGAFAAVIVVGDAPWPVVALVMILTPAAAAVIMERVGFRPVRGAHETTMLVISFAFSYLLQNVAILIFGAVPRGVNIAPWTTKAIEVGSLVIPVLSLVTMGVTVCLLLGLTLFFARTSLGIQMRAAAENFTMARVLGVKANRVVATAFLLSGLLAGIAAFLVVGQTGTVYPTMGLNVILVAFISTVLGGLGSLVGGVVGGFLLGGITVALETYLPYELRGYRDAFAYGAVIAVLLWRPQGLIAPAANARRV